MIHSISTQLHNNVKQSKLRGPVGSNPADFQGGPRGGGAPRGGRGGGPSRGAPADKKKKESILNLANYVDQSVKIKFMGGREGRLQHFVVVDKLTYSHGDIKRLRSIDESGYG